MRPTFRARLVNGPLFDPVLYVCIPNDRSALLFDCGRIKGLSNREVLSIDHVFISHTHMDHFMGMDQVLKVILHRQDPLFVYGPEGITEKVLSKLNAYTWNLTYDYGLEIIIHEVGPYDIKISKASASKCFDVTDQSIIPKTGHTIVSNPGYWVDAVILDHNIPCMCYALQEPFHMNIRGDVLAEKGFIPGKWIDLMKGHIMTGSQTEYVDVETVDGFKRIRAGELCEALVIITEGQKIAYITDIRYSQANLERIEEIARGVDMLFIEAFYMDELRGQAGRKAHLTSCQAGMIARMLNAKRVFPMHISPRYHNMAHKIVAEIESCRKP